VCIDEQEEPVEIPTESDGSLLLTSVTAQFPGATGLKFRNPETNTLRGVRMQGETMFPPTEEGWGLYTYICVRIKNESPKKDESRLKRKTDSDVDMYSKNIKVDSEDEDPDRTLDLIILGLPWKTSEDDIKEYFEPFGEIMMIQLKKRPGSGESKGFGFIKFSDKDVEKKVLLQRHMIDGRWCDIKIPESQDRKDAPGKDKSSCKIYVGGITENLTKEDLKDHFEAFGQVTDVYIPSPFRHFAFVQFSESKVAMSLLGKEHVIKDVSVKIGEAAPKGREGGGGGGAGAGAGAGGNRFGGYDGGYNRGGGNMRENNQMGGFGNPGQQQGGFSITRGYGGGGYGNAGPSWGMGGGPSYGMGGGHVGPGGPSFGGNQVGPGPSFGNNPGGFGGSSGFGGAAGGNFGGAGNFRGGSSGGGGNSWSNSGPRHQDRRY